jgi:RNA polymerase sigma-70 factor (ECF subfamily)
MMTDREGDEARWSRQMGAAQRGDARAYEALLGELAVAIERYVRRRFGSLRLFSEDCVQECLLAVHVGRHTYDPRRPFRPWLFAIVRNKTIDLLRRSYIAPGVSFDDAKSPSWRDYAADPADEVAAGQWLGQLEPLYRHALELTKLQGLSTAEAAVVAGVTETAMRARVSRALRATAQLLRKEQDA